MTKLARLTGVNGPFYIMAEKVLAIYKDENYKTRSNVSCQTA